LTTVSHRAHYSSCIDIPTCLFNRCTGAETMHTIRLAFFFISVCGLLLESPAARALDEAGAKLVITKFLASQTSNNGTASEAQHVITDLNGDGKPDIVLMWNVLGPTYFFPKLTIFLDQGRNYRALTADLQGQTEKLTVNNNDIVIDTLMPGPKDPRCCPTLKRQLRYRWARGKLTALK
jgi:hypothetical protein